MATATVGTDGIACLVNPTGALSFVDCAAGTLTCLAQHRVAVALAATQDAVIPKAQQPLLSNASSIIASRAIDGVAAAIRIVDAKTAVIINTENGATSAVVAAPNNTTFVAGAVLSSTAALFALSNKSVILATSDSLRTLDGVSDVSAFDVLSNGRVAILSAGTVTPYSVSVAESAATVMGDAVTLRGVPKVVRRLIASCDGSSFAVLSETTLNLYDGAGSSAGDFPDVVEVTRVGESGFAFITKSGEFYQVAVQVSTTTNGSQSPSAKAGKKPGRASTAAAREATVLVRTTFQLPTSQLPVASDLAQVGSALVVVGPSGADGVACAWLPLVGDDRVAVDPSMASEARFDVMSPVRFPRALRSVACHYVAVTHDSSCFLVSAVTTAASQHTRRGRVTNELETLSELLRRNSTAAVRIPLPDGLSIPAQWNHAVLRGAMKLLGASATQLLLDDAAAVLQTSSSFLEASTAATNVFGAGVTLQQQLAFRINLQSDDEVARAIAAASKRQRGAVSADMQRRTKALQQYATTLSAARSLGPLCARVAGRWQTLTSSSSGNSLRQIHGGLSAPMRFSQADTLAATVANFMADLPAGAQEAGSIFKATSTNAFALAKTVGTNGLSPQELGTLGLQ